ncbi:hypothetical protein HMI56_007373 [Coelomomyces lativittatus]|nr:hypothetical protein HMI56_007373 [Coelomomyces lativittatus]
MREGGFGSTPSIKQTYHCQKASILSSLSESSSSMAGQNLLGAWSPLYNVFATEISEHIQHYCEVPVLVALTFPELSRLELSYQKECLQGILHELDNVLKGG